MEKKRIMNALQKLFETAKKRNFEQSVELVVALKGIDLKKPENRKRGVMFLPEGRGKPAKVAIVLPKRLEKYGEKADKIVLEEELPNYSKREAKKLGRNYDFILAYVDSIPKLARYIGKYLGPRGKMPDAKFGMVIRNIDDIEKTIEKFKNSATRYNIKDNPSISLLVGSESMSIEKLANNIQYALERISELYPDKQDVIKEAFVKLTMSKAIRI